MIIVTRSLERIFNQMRCSQSIEFKASIQIKKIQIISNYSNYSNSNLNNLLRFKLFKALHDIISNASILLRRLFILNQISKAINVLRANVTEISFDAGFL